MSHARGERSGPAADRAPEMRIRPLRGHDEMRACVALQRTTWGDDFDQEVPTAILWAAQRTGGVASGAFDADGELVGFVFGITGIDGRGRLVHWSDMLAVRADQRGTGLGIALKQHQRELLRERGVGRIEWTFEPLEARNAWINFGRLGATSREYLRDVYGDTGSHLHAGIGTDRLVVSWRIDDDDMGVPEASTGGAAATERHSAGRASDVVDVLDDSPHPEPTEPVLNLSAPFVRIAVPLDIQRLKREAPGVAALWRTVTRAAFEHYLGAGRLVVGVTRDERALRYLLRND